MASDLRKPRGFSVIGEAEAPAFLAGQPVTLIWGVGKAFAATLERDGIRGIGQLQKMERGDLLRRYGTIGDRLYRLSRGEDERRVQPDRDSKSVSAETTFDTDLANAGDLVPVLRALSEKVSARLKKAGLAGRTVVLKLKTQDFRTRTRNHQLDDPTRLADRIFQTGLHLIGKELDGTKYRLLGIGVSDLSGSDKADPPDLVDVRARKRALAEDAIDALRDKFGGKAVETGYTFGKGHRGRPTRPDEDEGPEIQHPGSASEARPAPPHSPLSGILRMWPHALQWTASASWRCKPHSGHGRTPCSAGTPIAPAARTAKCR